MVAKCEMCLFTFNFSHISFKLSFMMYLVRPAHRLLFCLFFFFFNSFSLFANQKSYLRIFYNENSMHSEAMKAKPLEDLDSGSKANWKKKKEEKMPVPKLNPKVKHITLPALVGEVGRWSIWGIVESRTFISALINTRPASRESPLKLCHLLLKALQKERRREVFFFTQHKADLWKGKYIYI